MITIWSILDNLPNILWSHIFPTITSNLTPGGRLLVKDVESARSLKLAFTWLLDKIMDFRAPVRYWAPEEVQPLLESLGFEVFQHRMIDYLPYPHILYIATLPSSSDRAQHVRNDS